MKKLLNAIFALTVVALAATAPKQASAAAVTDGFGSIYTILLGQEAGRISNPSNTYDCDSIQMYGGYLGFINSFFCHMTYTMKLTSVEASSKSMMGITYRADLHEKCKGSDGVTYDLGAYVWRCGEANCTDPTKFVRVISACFNTNADLSINKGVLVSDLSVFGNAAGSALYAKWNLGTSVANQTFTVKTKLGTTFSVRTDGTRTSAGNLNASMLYYNGAGAAADTNNSARFAFAIDRAANTGTAYMEGFGNGAGSGFGTYSSTAAGDTPTTGGCWTRSRSATDWNYSVGSTGASCAPAVTFGGDSLDSVAAYTQTALLGDWMGMPVLPTIDED